MNPLAQADASQGVAVVPDRRAETVGAGTGGHGSADTDQALVEALRREEPWARAALVRKYHQRVERLVAAALGIDSELADVVQDVFVRVLRGVHQLKDPAALPSWISSLAVFTARGLIRKRRRWRWIRFLAPEEVPEATATEHDHEGAATLRAVYAAIDTLPADERLAFTLRFVSELELTEVASACRVSLATIKRRLTRAEAHFSGAAASSPLLRQRLRDGGRFTRGDSGGDTHAEMDAGAGTRPAVDREGFP
jgi:RNA polymerase sigma-70 factor (ECF subfamily)